MTFDVGPRRFQRKAAIDRRVRGANMRRFGVVGALAGVLIWTAPMVIADPADPAAPPDAAGTTLTLAELGSQSFVPFYFNRNVTTATLVFQVPTGYEPVQFRARLELPVQLRFGNLAVTQGNRTINRQQLPDRDDAEMVIPLDGVEVSGNWVNLTMTMSALPLDGYCWDPLAPVRLVDGSVTFTGALAVPTSVADFLPPVLRKVSIAIPGKPSPAESNAAIQLAAALAKRNGQQPDIGIVPLPAGAETLPATAAPLERQIVVKEDATTALSIRPGTGGPVLRVSGPADELARQVRLVADDALRFAVSTSATAQELPESKPVPDITTVAELSGSGSWLVSGSTSPGLSSETLWPRVGVDIDQTRWGHPVGGVSVHLTGSYTPLPTNFGGEVVTSVDGAAVDRWPADPTGVVDRTISIPDRLLKRFSRLEVMVRSTGDPGHCGDHLPIMLRIDGTSKVTATQANPPVPQGFQAIPQALMPIVRFGIGDDVLGDTKRAAQIVVDLQRASAEPLVTEVVPLQEAVNGTEPAVLISAGGWINQAIPLPFSAEQGQLKVTGINVAGDSLEMNLDPAKGFGSVQTVFDGTRTVLVATSTGDPRQLDELLLYLSARGRWTGLDGRAVLCSPGAEPIVVPNPPVDFAVPTVQHGYHEGSWLWRIVGGLAVLAIASAVLILLKARRGRID